jgi:hypothetical protein
MDAEKIDYILLEDNDDKINLTAFIELSEKQIRKNNNTDLLRYLTAEYYPIRLLFGIMMYNPFMHIFIKLDKYFDIPLSREDRKSITKIHIALIILTMLLTELFTEDTLWSNILKILSGVYLLINSFQLIKLLEKEML